MHSPLALLASALLASAATHDIMVGQDGLAFTPEAISAAVGDQVVFHFTSKNHTATQSSFADPCAATPGGFDSGFMPVANGTTDFPSFAITINDTKPVWVFCRQTTPVKHCGKGMVFSANCPSDDSPNSFTNFKNSALAQGEADAAAASSGYGGSTSTDASGSSVSSGSDTSSASEPSSSATSSSSSSSSSTSDSPSGGANAATSGSTGTVHQVIVGDSATLTYNPTTLTAAVGDVISFVFTSKNHTATQSTFATPCKKSVNTTTNVVGFDSGFMFIANGSAPLVWNVTVNDTAPIWVYCRQTTPVDHCGTGMVMAINSDESSTSTKSFSSFQAAAKAQNGTGATNGTTTANTGTGGAARASFSVLPAVVAAVIWALSQ